MITVCDTEKEESALVQVLIKSDNFSHAVCLFFFVFSCACACVSQYLPSTAVNTTLQLQQLRAQMLPLNIFAYIIPGTDAHLVILLSIIINSSGFDPCGWGAVTLTYCVFLFVCFFIRVSTSHHVMQGCPSWLGLQAQQVQFCLLVFFIILLLPLAWLIPLTTECHASSSTFIPHPH